MPLRGVSGERPGFRLGKLWSAERYRHSLSAEEIAALEDPCTPRIPVGH